jgi:hypothetical protein
MLYLCLYCWIFGKDPETCHWCGCECLQAVQREDEW